MRGHDEMRRAHDLAVEVLTGRVPVSLTDDDRLELAVSANVLAWALGDDADSTFAEELALLRRRAAALDRSFRPLPLMPAGPSPTPAL